MATVATKKPEASNIPENLKFMRDKDRTLVRGKFIYHEVPGGQLDFPFRKYAGDPIKTYSLKDGQIYELPLGVAKHLNKNVAYPNYSFVSEDGKQKSKITQYIRRCSFQSLEFIDIEGVATVGTPITQAMDA
jgi:hypothetical protein